MIKRLLILVVLAAAALACSPSDGGSGASPTIDTPTDALPSESMGTESASPSAS